MTKISVPTLTAYREEACGLEASMDFPIEIYNRPGLPAIRYRCASHSQFKHFMLSQLSAGNRAALHALTTRADDDFTIALLDALAVMSDVLTFYQERIAQESYLRTATEPFSILQMARFVGYKPKPGLAAATCLAFTLDGSPGSPQSVLIPERTQAQSIPKEQDKLPQTFETTVPITARVEWNELRPRMTKSQTVSLSAGEVFLQRANLNLQTGDVLLFIDKSAETPASKNWNIVRITKAEPQPQFDRTKVGWFWAGEEQKVSNKSEEVNVFVFRERANIFGYNAPEWGALPDVAKATYLGINDPAELTAEELWEWPQYFIQAPEFPYGYSAPAEPCRDVYPTPESVAAAVNAVTKAATDALQGMALSSIPNAAIQVLQAITTILDEILETAKEFQKIIQDATNENGILLNDLASKLRDLITDLVPFEGTDSRVRINSENGSLQYKKWDPEQGAFKWADIIGENLLNDLGGIFSALIKTLQNVKDKFEQSVNARSTIDFSSIARTLTELVQSLPVLAPYQAVVNILNPGNSENPVTNIGAAINNAAAAVTNVPESLAKAVGGHIVAKVVTMAVQAIMEMPIFQQDDGSIDILKGLVDEKVIDQLKDARLSLTPELVAFTAIVSAKLTVAVLRGLDITKPVDLKALIDDLFPGANDQEEKINSEYLAIKILNGAAVTGLTGLVAINILLLSFVWPTIIPVIIPLAIGYVLFAAVLGDDIFDGAKGTEKWICKVAKAALKPRKEDLSPRKELKSLSSNQIDLDKLYSKVTPGSLMLLSLPQTKALYSVIDVSEASRSDYTLNAKVTRVTLDNVPEKDFRPQVRMTTVFADSEKLEFSEAPDVNPVIVCPQKPDDSSSDKITCGEETYPPFTEVNRLTLDRSIPALEVGRRLIMTGLSDDEQARPLVDLLTLREHKKSEDRDFSELVFRERPGDRHEYQRDSVRIFANVAPATHGATVEEILGSGDAAQALQTFKLRQPPVTYVASGAETGSTSTLEVWVNDVLWEEFPFLHGIGPRRRAYSTEIDDSGQTMLRFGDGLDGARPHTGLENIRARYRSGIGTEGNVGAGDISLLTRRPPGVVNVTNPLPAESGNDSENPSNIRRNIPSTTRLLDRIVSLRDYEDFALTFPDVHKARAVQKGYGPDRKVLVTVAGDKGSFVRADPPDNRLEELRKVMRKAADPHIPFELQNYTKVQFVLAAQITYECGYLWGNISAAVCEALENHFAFDSRQFGQPVTLVEIMALIQGVAGVTAVDVDQLYRLDQTVQTAPPPSPSGFSIVSEESSLTSSSATVASEETKLKISFICTDSEKDYKDYSEKVNDYPDVLPEYLRVSPQELLLSREIALLFKEDKRI